MSELHPLYQLPQSVHPYVRACYEVAKEAHRACGHSRNKANDVSLDYITHPVAALNVLLMSGERDPVVMAASLLHDVLEDCEAFLQEKANELGIKSEPPYAAVLQELIDIRFEQAVKSKNLHKPSEKWLADSRKIVGLVLELTAPKGLGKAKRIKRALTAMNYSEDAAKIKIAELAASLADDIITRANRHGQDYLDYNDYVWAVAKSAAHVSDSRSEKQRNRQITSLFKLTNHLHNEHRVLNDYPEPMLSDQEKAEKSADFSLNSAWASAQRLPDWKRADPAIGYLEQGEVNTIECGLTHIGFTKDGLVTRCRIVFDYDSDNLDEHYKIINKLTSIIEFEDPGNAVTYGRSDVLVSEQGHRQIKLKFLKPISVEQFLHYAKRAGALTDQRDRDFCELARMSASAIKNAEPEKGSWTQRTEISRRLGDLWTVSVAGLHGAKEVCLH